MGNSVRFRSGKVGAVLKSLAVYLGIAVAHGAGAEAAQALITERGPHHAVFSRLSQYVNSYGDVVTRSNGYVALTTGMHYLRDGVWTESKEEIEILPSGHAIARQGQHRVIWAANANTAGAVDLYSSMDDKRFRSHVLGLAYTDRVTGQGVMFAVLKPEANGVVIGNQVLYPDCFDPEDGVVASLRYTYTLAGFEQDVIIHNQLPAPEEFGLDSATTRLELFTEFIEAPEAVKASVMVNGETDLRDDVLDFGALRIGTGNAFPTDDPETAMQTGKSWELREAGRRVMVESIDYGTIVPFLNRLPPFEAKARPRINANRRELLAGKLKLPKRPPFVNGRGGKMEMAKAAVPMKGFVMDYQTLLGGTTNDTFTFRGDTTYYVRGQVNLTGKTVFEGGTVIKCTNGTTTRLKLQGTVECRTGPWLCATITGKDDDTIGERISESTGSPAGTYGYYLDISGNTNATEFLGMRMRYPNRGVNMGSGCELALSHAQISKAYAAVVTAGGRARLKNVLIHDIENAVFGSNGTNDCEHVTFHRVNNLRSSSGIIRLTNCLVIAVTNNVVYTGSPNGSNSVDTGIFATLCAGARYLAAGSPYRNQGTTNINTNLLADLKQRTTYAPALLTATRLEVFSNLTQYVQRDNDSQPDYGYHYDPIDHCVGDVSVVGATLNIEPGVVLAAFGNKGIILLTNGLFQCSGTATQLAVLTRYNMVQEEANTNWAATVTNYSTVSVETGHTNTGFRVSFAKLTLPSGAGRHFFTGATNDIAEVSNCQLFGGEVLFEQGGLFNLLNNLLVRAVARLQYPGANLSSTWRNNTFYGGTAHIDATNNPAGNMFVTYTVFDNTTINQSNLLSAGSNAYYPTNMPQFTNTTGDYLFPSTIVYARGDLGDYYLPTNIVDFGPNLADSIGMYHFTTQTNNVREGTNKLDIGFHYLALTNGVPFDSDGDGEPDYLEDAFGDGLQGSYERNWLVHDRDSDYDGRTDVQETNELTSATDPLSVKHTLLGYWRFNTNTWMGEQGQLPVYTNGLQPLATWHGDAVHVGTNANTGLRYREVETNGSYNFNLRSGTIRFWYRPSWSSSNVVGGTGPPANASLFTVGVSTLDASVGRWSLALAALTNNFAGLVFGADSNGITVVHIDGDEAPCTFISNRWMQIALTYSPSNIALYTNGQLLATTHAFKSRPIPGYYTNLTRFQHQGHGICYWPPPAARRAGFLLGSGIGLPVNGAFEELEIYNYPMTAQEIARGFPNFTGASGVTDDYDYDGRSDLLEICVDGTDSENAASVASSRLGYWRFHGPATNQHLMMGEALQHPIYTNHAAPTAGWSSNAFALTGDTDSALAYLDVETNGWANFNCRNGAVSFWFKPNPPLDGLTEPLLSMGTPWIDHWEIQVTSAGLQLSVASNATVNTMLTAATNLDQPKWYHLALNYSPTACSMYLNSSLVATGLGVSLWPRASHRAYGLFVGNDRYAGTPVRGTFEELQTFNYNLTSAEIQRQYDTIVSQDRDLNGTPDLLEDAVLSAPRPFVGVPFAITGTIEAEQFDLGGPGVAYSNSVANDWTNDYRPSQIEITNCNDVGLGYHVNNLCSNDWLKYTIDVRVGQNYVIEPRVAGIGTNGGVFKVEFSTNGTAYYVDSGPLTVASTNWHDLRSAFVRLEKGTNVMKVSFLTNAPGSACVAKLNYISIYPGFNAGATNIITNILISASSLDTNESWFAATNNAGVIQKALRDLPDYTNGGGAITIPAGRWFIAPKAPDEAAAYPPNGAIYVSRSNTEIRGEGPNEATTTLITWFRSTSAFIIGRTNANQQFAVTNFTLRDISLEGHPHNRAITNSADGGFQPTWENGALFDSYGEAGSLVTVASHLSEEPPFTNLTQNVLFINCLFRNPGKDMLVAPTGGWSNCLVTASDFIFRDTTYNSTNGVWPFPRYVTTELPSTAAHPLHAGVGVKTRAGSTYNTLVISNFYLGNGAITSVNTNWEVDAGDGIFWGQEGGNWFVAANVISNYALEGIHFNGGPAAAVRNDFRTFVSVRATCALRSDPSWTSVNGTTDDPQDYSRYFVGNSVDGGRSGVLNEFDVRYNLHFAGNAVSLLPAFARSDDLPSAGVDASAITFGNISGNKLLAAECGIRWYTACRNTIALKNDFGAAAWRAMDSLGGTGAIQNVQIIKNVLDHGKSYHLKLRYSDSHAFFLQKNIYTNGVTGLDPFLDAAASPVHIMR